MLTRSEFKTNFQQLAKVLEAKHGNDYCQHLRYTHDKDFLAWKDKILEQLMIIQMNEIKIIENKFA